MASAAAAAEPAAAKNQPIAERIRADNLATHHVGGPDSDAGVGDWFLSNGTICAAISDPDHESAVTPQGGVLIDLGHCGADDDQWTVLQPILNLSQSHVVPVSRIEPGQAPGRAWLRTRALFAGIELFTTYSVDLERPTALSISVRARRIEAGNRLFSIGAIVLHPSGQTPVFSLLRSDLDRSIGFAYPSANRQSMRSMLAALVSSDLTVLVGGDAMPPISYGIERLATTSTLDGSDRPEPLASYSVTGQHFTVLNTVTQPLWFGATNHPPGLLQLFQLAFMDIADETELAEDLRIWVGERADVASITDRIFRSGTSVHGHVDESAARIHFDRLSSGAPVSQIRPESDGRFQLRLPAGAYRARVLADAGRQTDFEFEVPEHSIEATRDAQARETASDDDAAIDLPPIRLGGVGSVALPRAFIGRLIFLNLDGSGPAYFGRDHLGFRIGESPVPSGLEAGFVNLAASPVDPRRVLLVPGAYRVLGLRGPEYAVSEARLEVAAGETATLTLPALARVAPTPGWVAADLHVHTGESFDSSLPAPFQMAAFAASGAEVLVASEHDRIVDPRPVLRATGLASRIRSVTGVEMTSSYAGGDSPFASGHLNAFPLEPVAGAYRGGAPRLEGRRIRDALADVRAMAPQAFVQMNHPRPKQDGGEGDTYFQHLGVVGEPYDPARPLDEMPNAVLVEKSEIHGGRDLDYHGVELMNGGDMTRYRRTRADWFSLLLQGERIVGTANSDSHRLGRIVGLPRTYIAVPDDTLAQLDDAELLASLHAGRAYGSTGPTLRLHLDEAGIGALFRGDSGLLVLEVDAAPWIPLREWRAYVNGELVHRAPIAAGERAELPLAFGADAFVTVEIEGPARGVYADALPGFVPFAFSNPIFVDFDGNGRFDAPGLPISLPTTITRPDRPD